jgi:hypothetical protein
MEADLLQSELDRQIMAGLQAENQARVLLLLWDPKNILQVSKRLLLEIQVAAPTRDARSRIDCSHAAVQFWAAEMGHVELLQVRSRDRLPDLPLTASFCSTCWRTVYRLMHATHEETRRFTWFVPSPCI